jgi:putative phosphoesterase
MKIGILSDTHNQVERTRIAVAMLKTRGAEALIHCGDITTPEVVYECGVIPSHFVFGNCDYNRASLQKAMEVIGGICLGRGDVISLGGRKLAVTHGDSESELNRLEGLQPDYLFTGHTHHQIDERIGDIRRINPGALHRASYWSVALLDLKSDELEILRIERPQGPA